jgi:YihY family inner membrane protein
MSSATPVPTTIGLQGQDALATLRSSGRRRLLADALHRFRAADGFSHVRAMAFQFALTLIPMLITIVGLATVLEQDTFTRMVRDVLVDLAPGDAGDVVTAALRQGEAGSQQANGAAALAFGGLTTLVAGTTGFGQLERAANRLYGIEDDRPTLRKYALAAALMVTAGIATGFAAILLVAGTSLAKAAGWGPTFDILRWPAIALLGAGTLALLFKLAPARRQPEPSWLIFGSGISALFWLAFTAALAGIVSASRNFGATYGPLAGTIAILVWSFLSALALMLGLAVAAQLEAVRAGIDDTRLEPKPVESLDR